LGWFIEEAQNIKLIGESEASGTISIPQAARLLGLDAYMFYPNSARTRYAGSHLLE
jgi:hypothetical protein